jgi:hypothetical protein
LLSKGGYQSTEAGNKIAGGGSEPPPAILFRFDTFPATIIFRESDEQMSFVMLKIVFLSGLM